MRKVYFLGLISLSFVFFISPAFSANSKRFSLDSYYGQNIKGDYELYKTHGFVRQGASGTKTHIVFLPRIFRKEDSLIFIDENGLEFNPKSQPERQAESIIIPIDIFHGLPTPTQIPGVVSAISSGMSISNYMPPPVKAIDGSVYIYPPAAMNFQVKKSIEDVISAYDESIQKQQKLIDAYKSYSAELADLVGLKIDVIVNGQPIASVYYDESYLADSGTLSSVEVVKPTLYQQNRIAQGNFVLNVSYKFRDSNTSTINASFNAHQIVNNFLSETQESINKSSSSGWSFLGFGSRRKSVQSSFNGEVSSKYSGEKYEGTVIEMLDASDDMIAQFESDFFPELHQQEVIDNHLRAAQSAYDSGNTKLGKIHADYADALKNNDPNLEVDIAKAVAALSAGDYAGFIAHGVRFGDNKSSGNSKFRRIFKTQAEYDEKKEWSQVRTVSVQHALTVPVTIEEVIKQRPSLGLCNFQRFIYTVTSPNYPGYPPLASPKSVALVTCLTEGGALAGSGIEPGMVISKIAGESFTTPSELEKILDRYKPGDILTVTSLDQNGPYTVEREYKVTLKRGAPNL